MPRELGYVSPLLSGLAVDYSKKVREGLVAPLLFPRILVGKPSGKYAVFNKESAYKVPDVTMAGERSQANEFVTSGKMKEYATSPQGLKSFINKDDLQFMDGPFKLWERRKTETLVGKLEIAHEKRVADTVLGLTGRSTTLSGTGTAASNQWGNAAESAGGDPYKAIRNAIDQLFYRPNIMILNETVFDALEFHPKLLEKLGEANMIKQVNETTLQKLFRIDRVLIAKGRADFSKRKASGDVTVASIWGNSVVLAYTSDVWDDPCAGKTVVVRYAEADGQGYVVRTWDEEDGGILGGEYVQVAHDITELVVCEDLIYSIQNVV
jgi:hypothetical protein